MLPSAEKLLAEVYPSPNVSPRERAQLAAGLRSMTEWPSPMQLLGKYEMVEAIANHLEASLLDLRWSRLGLTAGRPTGAADDEFPFFMGPLP